nr:unnamed protein product [Callosobruchus analis]
MEAINSTSRFQASFSTPNVKVVPVREAAKKYQVSRATLQFRRSLKYKKKTSLRPTPYLTSEELLLVDWTIHCCKKGFPGERKIFNYLLVQIIFEEIITGRIPEGVTAASSNISESDIRKVFNADETCFNIFPKTSTVFAPRGAKNVYEIEHASSNPTITVLFTFSADVVFPGKRLKSEISPYCYLSHLSNITLICLYPNATRIVQPAVIEEYAKSTTIRNGFKATGLYLFYTDAIDFSKCLSHTTRKNAENVTEAAEPNNNATILQDMENKQY